MGFKGVYKEKTSYAKLGILLSLVFISVILHTLLATLLIYLFTNDGLILLEQQDLNNKLSVNYLKLIQLFSGIGLFITPTLLYSHLTDCDYRFNIVSRQNLILTVSIMMLITPLIGILLEWNMMIPFPDWLKKTDINSDEIIIAFLKMDSMYELFYTLLVIAVAPAIGEELLFRGYLQQEFSDVLGNTHVSILITAFIFSIIHLHLGGIIPRFILGLVLGYMFYWSRSLWLPILAHFVNNALVVLFSYPLFKVKNGHYAVFSKDSIDPMIALFSFVSVAFLLYMLYYNTRIKKG